MSNVIGQALGIAVAPEDIAFQYWKTYFEKQMNNKNDILYGLFPIDDSIQLGGEMNDAAQALKPIGYCQAARFNKYIQTLGKPKDWYISLHLRSQKLSIQAFKKEFEFACVPRVFLNSNLSLKVETLKNDIQLKSDPEASIQGLIAKIDSTLGEKRFVILNYQHHVVTIVGKSEDCSYIIQDSIPLSVREWANAPKYYFAHEGEFIQFWSKQGIFDALISDTSSAAISYIETK